MRILLLGEYSGFYSNLKRGFSALGHEVLLCAAKDGFKEVDGLDVTLNSRFGNKYLRKFHLVLQFLLCFLRARNYDAVFLINQGVIEPKILSGPILWYLKKFNRLLILSACGEDVPFIKFGKKNGFKWWIYDTQPECVGVSEARFQSYLELYVHKNIVNSVDGVIPTSYGYTLPWQHYHAGIVNQAIPLPIDTSNIAFVPSRTSRDINKKVVFFHGINRPCHKGTRFIVSALEMLQKTRPDEVSVIIKGGLPLAEYLNLLKNVDVVVDQCLGYDYMSMNAMYSLAMGKVVCVSAVDESFRSFGIDDHPIIQLEPNIDQIFQKLLSIVDRRSELNRMQSESRLFVERENNSQTVAQTYLDFIVNKLGE
jgi:glycosyltransferase involved in cell wall biosynthesis